MAKPREASSYAIECSNPQCRRYHTREPLASKPINRPTCQLCGAEGYVFGPRRVGPQRNDHVGA